MSERNRESTPQSYWDEMDREIAAAKPYVSIYPPSEPHPMRYVAVPPTYKEDIYNQLEDLKVLQRSLDRNSNGYRILDQAIKHTADAWHGLVDSQKSAQRAEAAKGEYYHSVGTGKAYHRCTTPEPGFFNLD